MSNRIQCNRCHKYFCISHRDPQDHICSGHPLATKTFNAPPPPQSSKREVCPLCGQSFSDVVSLINHTESKHNSDTPSIPPPSKTQPTAKPYIPPQRPTQADVYSPDEICPICSQRFRSTTDLINHCDTIHRGNNPPTSTVKLTTTSQREICDVCGKSFATINELISHGDQVHSHNNNSNNGGSEKCPKCNASFRTPEELVDHYESSHNNCTTGGCLVI